MREREREGERGGGAWGRRADGMVAVQGDLSRALPHCRNIYIYIYIYIYIRQIVEPLYIMYVWHILLHMPPHLTSYCIQNRWYITLGRDRERQIERERGREREREGGRKGEGLRE
jgi:hypothetical protein